MKSSEEKKAISFIDLPKISFVKCRDACFPKGIILFRKLKSGKKHYRCTNCGSDIEIDHKCWKTAICPICKKKSDIEIDYTKKWDFSSYDNCLFIEAHEGYQFVRYFNIGRRSFGRGSMRYFGSEIMRYIFAPDGSIYFMRKNTISDYRNGWSFNYSTPLTFRGADYDKFQFDSHIIGKPTLTPIFKYLKLSSKISGFLIDWMVEMMTPQDGNKTILETLAESKQWDAIPLFLVRRSPEDYKKQIFLAIRSKWKITEEWLDEIDDIRALHLDDKSPKYLFPANLATAHKNHERKIHRIRDEKFERKMLTDALKFEKKYESDHKGLLGHSIIRAPFEIIPLRTIKDFFNEGIAMSHCVFRNEYYKNKDSLVLSVRNSKSHERIETVEISIRGRYIIQHFGYADSTKGEFHTKIAEVVSAAIPEILSGISSYQSYDNKSSSEASL
jgi:hypothetical protein